MNPRIERIVVASDKLSTDVVLPGTSLCGIIVSKDAGKRDVILAAMITAIKGRLSGTAGAEIKRAEIHMSDGSRHVYPNGRSAFSIESTADALDLALGQSPLNRICKRIKSPEFAGVLRQTMIRLSASLVVTIGCNRRGDLFIHEGTGHRRAWSSLNPSLLATVELAVRMAAFVAGQIPFIVISQEALDTIDHECVTRLFMEIASMSPLVGQVILITNLKTIVGFPLGGHGLGCPAIVDLDNFDKEVPHG